MTLYRKSDTTFNPHFMLDNPLTNLHFEAKKLNEIKSDTSFNKVKTLCSMSYALPSKYFFSHSLY